MKIVFRADAGIEMGIGHVMRCMTLADSLSLKGHASRFICRDHEGNLASQLASRGYAVNLLARRRDGSDWLGASEVEDAEESLEALDGEPADWLVTDHYGIGFAWEAMFRRRGSRLLAIDDLANRVHDCDLLLDQTLGRHGADYAGLVPHGAGLLLGTSMALLRPRFAQLRRQSIRRQDHGISRLLVSLGGADAQNYTVRVLDALDHCAWPQPIAVDIVLGRVNPWIAEVRERAARSALSMRVLVDVSDMAELMAGTDLAIGTAGTTSWERCCLGLPSILVVAADNQRRIAEALSAAGAAITLDVSERLVEDLIGEMTRLALHPELMAEMSEKAAAVVDGGGCDRVVSAMESMS